MPPLRKLIVATAAVCSVTVLNATASGQVGQRMIARRFDNMDVNRDGLISGDEVRHPMLVDRFDADQLDECGIGMAANPAYGISFWLNQPVDRALRKSIKQLRFATDDMTDTKLVPNDVIFAAGAGK